MSAIDYSREIWGSLSNAAFLVPAFYLFMVGMYYESLCYVAISFFSTAYHVCYDMNACMV